MIKVFWFFIKVLIISALFVWLIEHPGSLSFDWLGYSVETSVAFILIVLFALWLTLTLTLKLVGIILKSPQSLTLWSQDRQSKKMIDALSDGMIAIAAGDVKTALTKARFIENFKEKPALAYLLCAQAEQLAGNDDKARSHYYDMIAQEKTEFLGYKGLIQQSIAQENYTHALSLAEQAYSKYNDSKWLIDLLYDLKRRKGDWDDALNLSDKEWRMGFLPDQEYHRERILLYFARAKDIFKELASLPIEDKAYNNLRDEGFKTLEKAYKLDSGLIPLACYYAETLHQFNKTSKALKVIEQSWKDSPHRDLIPVYKTLRNPDETTSQIKHLQKLLDLNDQTYEAHFSFAQIYLNANIWGLARDHLHKALALNPTKEIYMLLAQLERKEFGNETAALKWIEKATSAAENPQWTCTKCHTSHTDPYLTCPQCHEFGSVSWQASQ